MGVRITGGGGGGGALTDHQHTTSGDGGPTIYAQVVTGVQTLRAGDDGATGGELRLFDGVAVGRYVSLVPHSGGMTASRTIAMPDVNGTVPLIGTGADPATVAGTIARVQRPGQTATITAKTFMKTCPAGFYSIWVHLVVTTVGTGNAVFELTYVSDGGTIVVPIASVNMTISGNLQSIAYPFYLASGDPTWRITGPLTGTYALRVRGMSMEA